MAAPNRYTITFADGSTTEVQSNLEDRLAFETALRKNRGWGKLEDNTMKMFPFMAWHAAQRTGKTDLTWPQFTTGETAAISAEPVEDDDDEDEELEVEGLGKDTPTTAITTSRYSSPETTAAPLGSGDQETPAHA